MRVVIPSNTVPSQSQIERWIAALSGVGARLPGSVGGKRGEEIVETLLREVGVADVRRDSIALSTWEPEAAHLEVDGGSIPAYPITGSRFAPEGVEGEVIWLGAGDPESIAVRDLSGRIAVVELPFPHRPYDTLRKTAHAMHDPGGTLRREPETRATWILPTFRRVYSWCAARGAVGFIGVLKDLRANRHRYHYSYSWADEVLPVPAAFVGRDAGPRLAKLATATGRKGRLVTRGRAAASATANLLGVLPGASDEIVLVATHHDAPFAGAVDDATGVALLLAVASHFTQKKREQRALTQVFLAAAGNYLHNLGARRFLSRHAHDLVPRIVLTLTAEHVAREAEERDGKLVPTGLVEPRGIFVSDLPELLDLATLSAVGNDLRRSFIVPVPAAGGHIDGESRPYFSADLPSIGFVAGPEYLMTDDGGPEWVASEELVPSAKTLIEILEGFFRMREG